MLQPFWADDNKIECGCDEAGRGCLAGDVYAAAVIWDRSLVVPDIRDSKTLSERKRNELRLYIEKNAVAYSIGTASVEEIDRINILNASILAMHRAIDGLFPFPERILVDGNRFKPHPQISEHHCVVKGDNLYLSIAAASILAKTYRDEYMQRMHDLYPQYGWGQNKGYPTSDHRVAIAEYGASILHRTSFRWLKEDTSEK